MANHVSSATLLPWLSLAGLYLVWAWPCLAAYLVQRRQYPNGSAAPYIGVWLTVPVMALLIVDIFSRCSPSDLSACSLFGRAAFWMAK